MKECIDGCIFGPLGRSTLNMSDGSVLEVVVLTCWVCGAIKMMEHAPTIEIPRGREYKVTQETLDALDSLPKPPEDDYEYGKY